ncbi:oxygen-insensitive NADPH nitroreductase [Paenibacillus sp. GCM10028914]|uniref:oxygen-insensitive NADPH nitroreductase n=1 Tax=Paenibacillus sp. GCM10028914 TaxID=3273416 RepID=UPI00361B1272
MNETISLLMNHRSIRKYKSEQVTEEQLNTIIKAGQMASSSSSVQAYSVIAVSDPEQKRALSILAGNQAYIEQCSVFLVWCADLYRLQKVSESQLGDQPTCVDSTENLIVATADAALAAQNAAVAAESMGLGIVYIGGVRNQIAEFSEQLNLPELVYPVFGMCVGYPDQDPGIRPRLPLESVLHHGAYDAQRTVEEVKNYDNTYTEYMRARSGDKPVASWSQFMAKRLAEPVRLHMKDFLQGKGFMKR